MDRPRGDRPDGDRTGGEPPRRMPSSRWSGGSPTNDGNHRLPRGGGGGGGFGGGGGGRYHPYRGGPRDYPTTGGSGGQGFRGGPGDGFEVPMGGPKRGFPGRTGGSPDQPDGNKFVKLFVGSVPRTVTEEDIRPLFEEHGNVIEVALIRDRRSGQQQGFCFVKYATSEEADRAIAALHNQHTIPGALAPLQVRYADSERERHEDKLFVASLNKRATEQEIAEIFSPYGHVEDVYLMRDDLRQSKGCGFVKFSNREAATAAMNALHGTYVMRGCEQPLIVRFADPKRPRPEQRGSPAFGGPGFGPRSETTTVIGPTTKFDEPVGSRMPPNAWGQASPQSHTPSAQGGAQGFGNNQQPTKGGGIDTSSLASGISGETGGPLGAHQPNFAANPLQQGFNPSMPQMHPLLVQQMPQQLQNPLMVPQQLPPSLQQGQPLQPTMQQLGQFHVPQSTGVPSGHPQQLGPPLVQPNAPISNQQQLPTNISQQLLQRPIQQMPSQIPQALLQQQAQSLQSTFQQSQQAILQLQQQLQLMQQSGLNQQQASQNAKQQQSPWSGAQPTSGTQVSTPAAVMPSAAPVTPSVPVTTTPAVALTCNWTEHTSPQGFKYYYNSVTQESKWEKPEEYAVYEQQQQQQKLLQFQQQQQKVQPSTQTQSQTQIQPNQQIPQIQHLQTQMQLRQHTQLQGLQPSLAYQASGANNLQNTQVQNFNYAQLQAVSSVADSGRVQQGIPAAQEFAWQNKSAGS